jgi:hypothetical protein
MYSWKFCGKFGKVKMVPMGTKMLSDGGRIVCIDGFSVTGKMVNHLPCCPRQFNNNRKRSNEG